MDNIHPEFHRMLGRADKEALLRQTGCVIWLYGLSGSGKSTLANALERHLHSRSILTQILDGDNIRSGLNSNLGFSDADRTENIRRIAEVAKLFRDTGIVTIASFITPTNALRQSARDIVGENFLEIYVRCPYETCASRDVKGLYAKAKAGGVANFTGKDSTFEEPDHPDLIIDTSTQSLSESLSLLLKTIHPLLPSSPSTISTAPARSARNQAKPNRRDRPAVNQ